MKSLLLEHYTATSCIGRGIVETLAALRAQRSGLKPCNFDTVDVPTYIGEVTGADDIRLPTHLAEFDCRNNRLAFMGLQQDGFTEAVRAARDRYGSGRIGVFLGTSTSGILQTELAYRRRKSTNDALPADFFYRSTHNAYSVADFTRRYFELSGPATAVSSACSSSAKVFSTARRMIAASVIDAAVVGGVDSLCLTTLYGFNSLELTSSEPCRPFDARRSGISIGEAAAFALLTRAPDDLAADAVLLTGTGETSDAYHMSSPHPEGLGARLAMRDALAMAGLKASDIDYINLHGTATQTNDAAEGKAVIALFGPRTPCSSTKGATGHTLGAAGGMEGVICALALRHGLIPAGVNTRQRDASIDVDYVLQNRTAPLKHVLSNSFGFGGTNCSLIFSRAG